MAAEADSVADDTLNGRYYATAASAATVVASLPPSSGSPPVVRPLLHQLPPTQPLITNMPSAVTCSFVGEGSANVVFCVTPSKTHANDSTNGDRAGAPADAGPLSTHLLRIPKAGPGVDPTTCLEHYAYYSTVLRPLIGADWLVGQHLVHGVVSSGVHAALDKLLADLDRSRRRRPDWVGTRVAANVDVALLVEDMTSACQQAASPSTTTTIQCKPKWLVQSPSAPAGARRCRTCALSAASAVPSTAPSGANGHAGRTKKASPHKIKPCPMVLVADPPATPQEEAALEAALWDYVCKHLGKPSSSPPVALLKARPAIVRWLRTTSLFRRMAAFQAEFDPHGALSVDLEGPGSDGGASSLALDRLQTAMTLRDCTYYLRITTGDGSGSGSAASQPVTVSAKLGDLDRKDGRRKLARWQAQEHTLLAGGFYLGTEEPQQQTQCWLERQRC